MGVTVEYEQDIRDGVFEVVTRGPADIEVFGALLREMVEHPAWTPGSTFIHDHTALEAESMTTDEVRRIADNCEVLRGEIGPALCAVIVPEDLVFALSRMWEAYVDGRWDAVSRVMRSRDEALAWIAEQAAER